MQIYLKGSVEAAELYVKAFDAELVVAEKDKDGSYIHAEINVEGQIISISETIRRTQRRAGSNMQFCLQFDDGSEKKINKAFEMLHKKGKVIHKPGTCFFSPYMTAFVDKFGVYWCLFI